MDAHCLRLWELPEPRFLCTHWASSDLLSRPLRATLTIQRKAFCEGALSGLFSTTPILCGSSFLESSQLTGLRPDRCASLLPCGS